ncbi:tyrosine-type recombinase/integrase [Ohtaekwangia koreensis]|uniref:tyrosine-type recombinase/integrase n=1 Tax=Ohtaekwangia koreensis TaxID=688867 RepID=UPI0009A7310F
MLYIIYSAGLRISEVLHLKSVDLDIDRGLIYIHSSKHNKDRVTLVSKNTYQIVQQYLKVYQPQVWSFEGPTRQPYSVRSVNAIIK